MKRLLFLLAIPLLGCWDGGPFAPRKVPHNPCHPYNEGQPMYEIEQDLSACPIPNR